MNRSLMLTDSLPLDFEGLNAACLKATAAAKGAEELYAWAAMLTPGSFIGKKLRALAAVQEMKAEALCALLERGTR